MMRTVIAALLCLYAIPATAQDCSTLSPNGQAAAYWLGQAEYNPPASFFTPGVTRGFASGLSLTFRIVGSSSTAVTKYRRYAARFIKAALTRPGCPSITLTEVPATSDADITFLYGTKYPNGMAVGCAGYFYDAPDTFTITRAYVYSNPSRSGCDSQFLMVHELHHLLVTIPHDYTSGYQLRGLAAKSLSLSGCAWPSNQTPEQIAADPCWEARPGMWEAANWGHRQAPGTEVE
jgi:hypothetical protein